MFFWQRLRLPVSRRTIRRRAEPLSQPLRGTWREARGPKGQAQRTPMDSATSRPGRGPRRRHDGVDADCAGAAEPSRGGNCCAAGHRYRATVAAVSWLVAGTRRPAFGPRPTRPVRHLDARRARLHAVDGGAMGPYDQEIPSVVRGGRPPARGSDGGRVSTANMVSALRAFLGYAAKEGWRSNRLAESISRPRLYQQESLPYAPDWSAVQQMLADVDTDKPRDIRDRAMRCVTPAPSVCSPKA